MSNVSLVEQAGMLRLASYSILTPVNKCAKTNSATDCDDAAGVLITASPLSRAYFTSILSIPTPARPITLRFGHASITSVRTVVALLTNIASKFFNASASFS